MIIALLLCVTVCAFGAAAVVSLFVLYGMYKLYVVLLPPTEVTVQMWDDEATTRIRSGVFSHGGEEELFVDWDEGRRAEYSGEGGVEMAPDDPSVN